MSSTYIVQFGIQVVHFWRKQFVSFVQHLDRSEPNLRMAFYKAQAQCLEYVMIYLYFQVAVINVVMKLTIDNGPGWNLPENQPERINIRVKKTLEIFFDKYIIFRIWNEIKNFGGHIPTCPHFYSVGFRVN